ncbi:MULTISPECIES: thioredoxin family protein [Halolamina]|uniref:Thiol-disulfide isomerase or thioredoxin n=1 Tax=Halolamina pelagica TaxID=699431 RepID=A0A1I5MW71_9EURY|nr:MULTISPECIES: thioredoxin family protein [Halolamina]NHX36187.1 thioredoxin [Halolamina sp. R1-12]SFP13754.1 Thiol-disulfide isomerase or thioredoxin [Halolamina pelagica]
MSNAEPPESTLSTLQPDPTWDAESHADAVDALGADGLTFRVWGGDWCGDCRQLLPAFAAALDAAGVPDERIHAHAVEREDGEKVGEGLEEYGIELIPTVIVERDGSEIARFVESEGRPIAEYLADAIAAAE